MEKKKREKKEIYNNNITTKIIQENKLEDKDKENKKSIQEKKEENIESEEKRIEREKELLIHKLGIAYDNHLHDSMGILHNRFVSFISESRLPLPHVITVLTILLNESIDQFKKKIGLKD